MFATWTAENIERVRELRAKGVKIATIARELGVTRPSVKHIIRRFNMPSTKVEKQWSPEEIEQVRKWKAARLTYAEMAKRVGATLESVRWLVRSRRLFPGGVADNRKWTDDKIALLRKWKNEGDTNKEIARRLGIEVESVTYAVHQYRVLNPQGMHPRFWTEERLGSIKKMLQEGCGYREIANKFGCSIRAVKHVTHQNGLKLSPVAYRESASKRIQKRMERRREMMHKRVHPYYGSSEMGYIIGVMWVGRRCRDREDIEIYDDDKEFLIRVSEALQRVTGLASTIKWCSYISKWGLFLCRQEVVDAIYERWRVFFQPRRDFVTIEHRRYGTSRLARGYSTSIEGRVMKSKDREFYRGLLQGAFDTRGIFVERAVYTKLRLRIRGWKLRLAVMQLLYAFGIKSYLNWCRPLGVRSTRGNLRRFRREIGFRDKGKEKALTELISHCPEEGKRWEEGMGWSTRHS